MLRLSSFTLVAATALLFGYSQAQAVINSIQTAGSGCPGGNGVSTTIGADNLITLAGATGFRAALGGDVSQRSKSCEAMISVTIPPGQQFTVIQSDFPGWARLDDGATATVIASFYFQSSASETFRVRKEFKGPEFAAGAPFSVLGTDIRSELWSACGQQDVVIINDRIAMVGTGTGEAAGLVDPGQNVKIVTRPC